MDINPFGCKAAIQEVFPTNLFLPLKEMFKDWGVFARNDGRMRPMLKAKKKEAYRIR